MQKLVDFHCHIDLYPEYRRLIDTCERENMFTLAVTTTPRAWPQNRDLMRQKKNIFPALGLHPQLIRKDSRQDLILWEKYLPEAKYVGEVGIDASNGFNHTLKEQKIFFKHILKTCAEAGGKILSVHSVRSANIILDIIEEFMPKGRGKVVLHWFSGSKTEAKRAIEAGCFFSVNTKMLATKKGIALIKEMPFERLLTETDGPFIKWKNQPVKPSDIMYAINLLASVKNKTPEFIVEKIASNLKILLG
jgi:TatD DNase family protein